MSLIKVKCEIQFDPQDVTKKHKKQSLWKKIVIAKIKGDWSEYYAWFIKKRFNLELNRPLRGAHITLINDSLRDIGDNIKKWDWFKKTWNGMEIEIELDTSPRNDYNNSRRFKLNEVKNGVWTVIKTDLNELNIGEEITKKNNFKEKKYENTLVARVCGHWWLQVPHDKRQSIDLFRAQIGLGRPYFGPHMTIGHCNEKNRFHNNYICRIIEKFGI